MKTHRGCLVLAGVLIVLTAAPAAAGPVRIYITDSAADTVHVIDAATNKVVQVIRGIEAPHGVTFVQELPKTATGKIQKYVLRKGAAAIVRQ